MVALGFVFVLFIISTVAGSIGFLIGYYVGRRSGAKDRRAGFPVLPKEAATGEVPQKNPNEKNVNSWAAFILVTLTLILGAPSYAQASDAATRPALAPVELLPKATQPPISIDIEDATLADVATALGKATATKIIVAYPAAEEVLINGDRYTLKASDKSFWEVFEELDRQHTFYLPWARPADHADLALAPRSRITRRFPLDPTSRSIPAPRAQIRAGDFMIFVELATRTYPDSPLLLHWSIAADPRVTLPRVRVPYLAAVDDRGEKLQAVGETGGPGSIASHEQSLQTRLTEPPTKLGTKLVSLKAEVRLSGDKTDEVVVRFECADIPIRQ